jgi:hypothetical protein
VEQKNKLSTFWLRNSLISLNKMKYFLIILIFVIGLPGFTQPVRIPQIEFSPKSYVCYKTDRPITPDGRIIEKIWQSAKWTEDFTDIEGSKKSVPRFKTRVKMLWDDTFLYIAAELEEPDIWGNLTNRDTVIFYDNDFEIFIDPDGDTREYYEVEMNALNTIWDLLLTGPYRDGDDGKSITSWDILGLRTGIDIQGTLNKPGDTDTCWTVEAAIPWHVIKECAANGSKPKNGDQWRFNFSRVEWTVEVKDGRYEKKINPETGKPFPENNWVWSPQGMINIHYPEMWGFVQFSEKIAGTSKDRFVFNPDENIKWALRQIYYYEKLFFEKHNRFTSSFKELGMKPVAIKGYLPPVIHCTQNLFEATMYKNDKTSSWHIIQNSKTWKDN